MKGLRNGQSTLEYVIILSVIVGAVILIAGQLKSNLSNSYTTLGNKMESKVGQVNF